MSPIMNILFQLNRTALIMLAKPFPPAPDKPISLVILIVKLITDSLSVPNQHIIVNLHSLSIQEHTREPIGQPARGKHLMV